MFFCLTLVGQNNIHVSARLFPTDGTINLTQTIEYQNSSSDTLRSVFLTDWAHSFSSKTTPLAKNFAENYEKKFHLAKEEDRGYTQIRSIESKSGLFLQFKRPEEYPDVIEVFLEAPLLPGESYFLRLSYKVKLPNARFTRYGKTKMDDFNLRFWFITPSVYDGQWHYYSNKNLNDRFVPKTDMTINLSIPKGYFLVSDLDVKVEPTSYNYSEKIVRLTGADRVDAKIFLRKDPQYKEIRTDYFTYVTNLGDVDVPEQVQALIADKVAGYLHKNLGPYPHDKLLVTEMDYEEKPIYGLNSLPDFIQPFPDGFQYEMEILKTTVNNYVNNTILVNPRYDYWMREGLKVFLIQKYLNTYYPKAKAIGNLSRYWLFRQFYASELEFQDQFNMLYIHMARLNLDQSLTTANDSLNKFNRNIASAYKSGAGLNYLNDFLGNAAVDSTIKTFYNRQKLELTSSDQFENDLKEITDKNIDWYFTEYVGTRKKIDFKLGKTRETSDSLYVTVRNKRKNDMPVSLYGFKNDSLVFKKWVTDIGIKKEVAIANDSVDKLVLNYEKIIPEYNLRDNYKTPGSFLSFDKPLQFKLFQDFENPAKSQVFFMPVFEYNLYDGFSPGIKMYNKTILTKGFNYKLEPQYGLRSKTIVGSASVSYTHFFDAGNLYRFRYGISGNRYSYQEDLFYRRITPYFRLDYRTPDFRSDKRESFSARFISVQRDEDASIINQSPNYNVFNARYSSSKPGIVDAYNWNVDAQVSERFSKLSTTFSYRHLYLNNRQLNLRFFAGGFIFNDTENDGDFFSFALDRPSDYLFDYNYYGRSEDSGLFSQQLILAEGGFKSQLEPDFANQWITTANASTTLWKYIYAYGDIGLVKNKNQGATFVYDSGIQLSLLDDYFELYFPVYSNNGWEITQPNYDEKIRFIVTLSIDTFIKLFTRKWY